MGQVLWRKPLEECPGPDSEGGMHVGWLKGSREETEGNGVNRIVRKDQFDSSRKQESTRPGKKCRAVWRNEGDTTPTSALGGQ